MSKSNTSRIDNSIRNAKYSFLAQIANLMVQFVSRTIFIQILGKEYLGLNGLFGNILTILSLADMGIGTVLVYTMYKPLAEKNYEKIRQLINMYRKIYRSIAIVILCAGICLVPFLHYLIKDMPDIPNLTLIYLLYLANTVTSYLYVYKISIINADQKNYIVTFNQQVFTVIANLAMIIVLLLTRNFLLYLLTQIVFSITSNFYLSRVAEKLYPYIKDLRNAELSKSEKREIRNSTFAMMLHKIGGVVVSGTDNLLISVMVSLDAVGIYSNYLLIINAVKKIISMYSSSIIASVGNLTVTENTQKMYTVFKRIFYSTFIITAFCATCLLCLINPFIELWLGEGYTFNFACVAVIVAIFYIDGMRQSTLCFIDALGLFKISKLKPILEAITNLILSVLLTLHFGVIGVFLGTALSMLLVCIPWEAYILYKYSFKRSVLKYATLYIKSVFLYIVVVSVSLFISSLISTNNLYLNILFKTLITASTSVIMLLVFTYRTKEFKYFVNLLKSKIKKEK